MGRIKIPSKEELDNIFEKFGLERLTTVTKDIEINKLKPHPRNELIYGQEDVSDLVAQIEERGRIVVPLIINSDYIILSGHRRWNAAKALNFKTVPCEVRFYESPEEELEFLLHSNVTRKKTREQKAREGMALEEVLSVQSLERRNANLKQYKTERDESSTSDNSGGDSGLSVADDNIEATTMGRTRDEVAKALRIGSGKQFDRMKAVVERADELKKQEKPEDAALFVSILNRSPSAAYDLLEVDLASLSDEDKSNLRAGKVAPRSFIGEGKDKRDKARRETSYSSAMSQLKGIESQIKELMGNMSYVSDQKQKQNVLERIEKQIKSLQDMLPTSVSQDIKDESES